MKNSKITSISACEGSPYNWNPQKLESILDDEYFEFQDLVPTSQGGPMSSLEPPYSYNWPYDYFSLVELANVEGGVIIESDEDE